MVSHWRRLLPLLVSIAIALSILVLSVTPIETRYLSNNHWQVLSQGHIEAGHHQPLGQKVHPLCGPLAGCFAFALTQEPVIKFVPMTRPINPGTIVELTAWMSAPPVPPPISIVFA